MFLAESQRGFSRTENLHGLGDLDAAERASRNSRRTSVAEDMAAGNCRNLNLSSKADPA